MKSKYFYKGESLIDYCKKNPKYKYNNITKYISDEKRKNPNKSDEEIIDEIMNKDRKSHTRIIINNMTFKRYCEFAGLNYVAIIKAISRARKDKKYADMDEYEIANMIIEKYLSDNMGIEELIVEGPKKLTLKPENKKDI